MVPEDDVKRVNFEVAHVRLAVHLHPIARGGRDRIPRCLTELWLRATAVSPAGTANAGAAAVVAEMGAEYGVKETPSSEIPRTRNWYVVLFTRFLISATESVNRKNAESLISGLLYTCTRYRGTFADFVQDNVTEESVCTVDFNPAGTANAGAAAVVAEMGAEYGVKETPSSEIPRTRNWYVVLFTRFLISATESVNRKNAESLISGLLYTCTRYRGTFADFVQDNVTEESVCTVDFNPAGTANAGAAAVVAEIGAEYGVKETPSSEIPRTRNWYVVLFTRFLISATESVNRKNAESLISGLLYTCTRYRGTFADFVQDNVTEESVCTVDFNPAGTANARSMALVSWGDIAYAPPAAVNKANVKGTSTALSLMVGANRCRMYAMSKPCLRYGITTCDSLDAFSMWNYRATRQRC